MSMILNEPRNYVEIDPDYFAPRKEESAESEVERLIKEDAELEKLCLQDICDEIFKRRLIFYENVYGLQKLDCDISNRIIDLGPFAAVNERIPLIKEQVNVQFQILREKTDYFKDTARLRELVLKKKQDIRSENSDLVGRVLQA